MKHFCLILALAGVILACTPAMAQITVDEVTAETDVNFADSVKSTAVDVGYFSLARYKAERAAIRKERNYLEFSTGLQGTLTAYNNAYINVKGGDNSIAVIGNIYLYHSFTKNLFTVETKFDAKLGYNRMKVETSDADGNTSSDGVWFKNQDQFAVSVAPSFKMAKNWSYGATFKFRSQFVNGYVSRTQQEATDRKSTLMSPGYLDASLGVTYKCPEKKFPVVINIAPIALSATFVESAEIRNNKWDGKAGWQVYGLDGPDKTSKYEGGSSIEVGFDRKFGKSEYLRYRTTLFSFYGWITNIGKENKHKDYSQYVSAMDKWDKTPETKPFLSIHPTCLWDNTLDIKATKYLTTTLTFQLYYNRAQNVDIQTQTLLSVGLTYTFKNKEKK